MIEQLRAEIKEKTGKISELEEMLRAQVTKYFYFLTAEQLLCLIYHLEFIRESPQTNKIDSEVIKDNNNNKQKKKRRRKILKGFKIIVEVTINEKLDTFQEHVNSGINAKSFQIKFLSHDFWRLKIKKVMNVWYWP